MPRAIPNGCWLSHISLATWALSWSALAQHAAFILPCVLCSTPFEALLFMSVGGEGLGNWFRGHREHGLPCANRTAPSGSTAIFIGPSMTRFPPSGCSPEMDFFVSEANVSFPLIDRIVRRIRRLHGLLLASGWWNFATGPMTGAPTMRRGSRSLTGLRWGCSWWPGIVLCLLW